MLQKGPVLLLSLIFIPGLKSTCISNYWVGASKKRRLKIAVSAENSSLRDF